MLKFNRLAQMSKDEEVIAGAVAKSTSGLLEVTFAYLLWFGAAEYVTTHEQSLSIILPLLGSRRQKQNPTQSREKDSWLGQQLEGWGSRQVKKIQG